MMFTWEHLIDVAEDLINCHDQAIEDEAYFRSAINRAYYGAHKSAHDLLEAKYNFVDSGKGNIHAQVLNALRNHPDEGLKRLYWNLNALRKMRIDADYEYVPLNGNFNVQRANTAIQYARSICKELLDAGAR